MLARIRAARENESGFTLIELLIVIVILGVLSGIVVFSVSGITDRGQASACASSVKTVQVAGEAAYAKNGAYPATMILLAAGGFLQAPPPGVTEILYKPKAAAGTVPASLSVTKGTTGVCAP